MKNTDQLVNESILNVFSSFKAALKKEYKERSVAISSMHLRSLQMIRRNSPCTSQMVSDVLNRDKSQVARLIGELVKQGYVATEADPKDRRNRLLTLTPEGEAITRELELVERSVVKRMIKGITRDELDQFLDISRKMRKNIIESRG